MSMTSELVLDMIDAGLLEQAQKLGCLASKKDAVNLALKEFVQRRKQIEITELFGTMDPDADYDYKKSRQK